MIVRVRTGNPVKFVRTVVECFPIDDDLKSIYTYDIAHNCVAEDLDERIFSQDTKLLVNLHLNKGDTASITWIGGRIKYLFVF